MNFHSNKTKRIISIMIAILLVLAMVVPTALSFIY